MNHESAHLAIRNRLEALVVCTTGSQTLEAIATGYQRSSGSFLTDGFAVGMEVTPTGFPQTTPTVIAGLTATVMTTKAPRTVAAPAGSRTLAAKLPALRGWENLKIDPAVTSHPYVEGDYVPATQTLLTAPSSGGIVEDTGLYVLRWYGIANTGLLALTRASAAVLALFPPGATVALPDGSALRWRENPGPWRNAVRLDAPGWAVVTITIPWRTYTQN